MDNTPGTTTTVTVGDQTMTATWVGTDQLVPGRTFVVEGPSTGMFWVDQDRVVGVAAVDVFGDRTNTRVRFTDSCGDGSRCDTDHFDCGPMGNWSKMTFLTVDQVAC